MEALTHSPSSPRPGGSEFEVFLSFRGEDTRKRFIGHLYEGLEERGICTFIDSEKLEKGEEINKLLEYIERSKIFVPIFSQRFAESKWCLKEVTKSVECRKEMIPVFFDVEPSDVCNQTGPFRSAFEEHESDKKLNQEEVRNWREALKKVGSLSGFTLKDMNWDEAELKRAVIERVSAKLNKKPFEVAKHPVGIQTRVNDVKKMLQNGGNINGVHVVGMHGMGGLGKTTIAKAVYNELVEGFNGATCFISNVRENAGQPNGLVNLQKQLIEYILKEKDISLSDVARGKNVIKDRASRKKVLLILDDVDNIKQLDALAGGRDWFGSGSVIIITTRDEEVLLAHNLKQDEIYKPQELNENQSRELFMLHAFKGEQSQGEYFQLSNEVVAAAGGLPLTLEVIGSLLSSKKNVQDWKDNLEKLKKIPPREVQQRLKLSYDSLDDELKEIFLDIACFFIGKKREYATYLWEGCDWFPNAAITVLERRSLIKIRANNVMDDKYAIIETYEKYEVFEMHDQIRDMGRAIVDEKCSRKLQKKSRLWKNQESRDLLQRKGPKTIDAEGIEISFYKKYCTVSAECFESMPNLRYLNANNVKFQGTFPCFPTDLKWLQLSNCHFDSPPSDFNLEKLVILDICLTNMAPILRLKDFERLKFLSIVAVHAKITLDFMNMTNLVTLRFQNCSALTTIDETIGELKNLTHLRIMACNFLRKLPDSIWRLSSLEVLNISCCSKISSLPERLGELGSLKKLDLSFTFIKRLPDSICLLSSLEMLCLKGCFELRSIPEGLGDMLSLKKIDHFRTGIEVIPDFIGQLTDLQELDLCELHCLDSLPESICHLKLLKSLSLRCCDSLCSLPETLGDMEKLEKLILAYTGIKNIPDSVGQLKLLKLLDLSECRSLCSLPERLGDMEKLEELILDSTRIEAIPDSVGRLDNLRLLSLKGCKFIKGLPISIRQLSSLQRLEMSGTNLNVVEGMLAASIGQTDFARLSSLESLGLEDCKGLEYLPQLPSSLHSLNASRCTNLRKMSDISNLKNLRRLCLGHCKQLEDVPGLENISSNLETLELPGPCDFTGCCHFSHDF